MNKYSVEVSVYEGPEDMEAGRTREVVHIQAWQDGRWLPPVASRCTKKDAERICKLLNDECEALELLKAMVNSGNSRGRFGPGGSDFNTEEGRVYRAAVDFLNR